MKLLAKGGENALRVGDGDGDRQWLHLWSDSPKIGGRARGEIASAPALIFHFRSALHDEIPGRNGCWGDNGRDFTLCGRVICG